MNEDFLNTMNRLYGENPSTNIEVNESYEQEFKEGKITELERQIMYMQQHYITLNQVLTYVPSQNPDINDQTQYQTVDAPVVLRALYHIHEIHPEMNIAEKFNAFINFSALEYNHILKYIFFIIKYEKEQIATFKSDLKLPLLRIQSLLRYDNFFESSLNNKDGEYAEFENGSIGMFEKYNEVFKAELNFDLFEDNELYANSVASRRR